jgi:hypothetical protein
MRFGAVLCVFEVLFPFTVMFVFERESPVKFSYKELQKNSQPYNRT